MQSIKSEEAANYASENPDTPIKDHDDATIREAKLIIARRFKRDFKPLESPALTGEYLSIVMNHEYEVFACIMMDNRNRIIAFREMFRGTVDGAAIYPREVVKQALADNAACVILVHNHPSGVAEPSQADIQITERLKKALALVNIRVLDHVIIGETTLYFSERGLI